ncbi:NAD-dependent epimerase/dehydratase family protein [Algoriphagus sediminis]|uniref:NAD-dependent epimerase/dehydratase family protein n=1 Tax=Algoriphagus sediminis TaxID=3057113 RepID=A0ABT7Y8S4_9BACT|nr:NAD-dependent epimerase/dehydratase family protein [Algoriphagus sediminis]MDN3202923.1 NAD-dependent epimerase/dehydratase family protein [Algoriphagus sediminis]
MKKNRRQFIQSSIALGLTPLLGADAFSSPTSKKDKPEKMKILILGGTGFLGPHQVAYALERGHEVSIFTRGRTVPSTHEKLFSKVEKLVGDRENDLEALKGRKWDVVIDNSGRRTKWTEDSAKLLVDKVGYYMYTSSLSVFYPFYGNDFTENRPVVTEIPADATESEKANYEFGVMKATSELATIDSFGKDRSIIVRPTLIVGPGDRTDRFPYWMARIEKGGDIIIPGSRDEVVQYIDVRDLAEWMIRLLEEKAAGTYNASGPGFEMTTDAFVHGIHACFNSPVRYTQIDDLGFLQENGIIGLQPWVIQLPEYAGMSKSDNSKAKAAGLEFRPLAQTVQDTHKWWYSDAVEQERRDNILNGERSFMKKEEDILTKWKQR